jgi:hypothetical protein
LIQAIATHSTSRTANDSTNDSAIPGIATAGIIANDRTGERTNRGTRASIAFHIAGRGACTQAANEGNQPN